MKEQDKAIWTNCFMAIVRVLPAIDIIVNALERELAGKDTAGSSAERVKFTVDVQAILDVFQDPRAFLDNTELLDMADEDFPSEDKEILERRETRKAKERSKNEDAERARADKAEEVFNPEKVSRPYVYDPRDGLTSRELEIKRILQSALNTLRERVARQNGQVSFGTALESALDELRGRDAGANSIEELFADFVVKVLTVASSADHVETEDGVEQQVSSVVNIGGFINAAIHILRVLSSENLNSKLSEAALNRIDVILQRHTGKTLREYVERCVKVDAYKDTVYSNVISALTQTHELRNLVYLDNLKNAIIPFTAKFATGWLTEDYLISYLSVLINESMTYIRLVNAFIPTTLSPGSLRVFVKAAFSQEVMRAMEEIIQQLEQLRRTTMKTRVVLEDAITPNTQIILGAVHLFVREMQIRLKDYMKRPTAGQRPLSIIVQEFLDKIREQRADLELLYAEEEYERYFVFDAILRDWGDMLKAQCVGGIASMFVNKGALKTIKSSMEDMALAAALSDKELEEKIFPPVIETRPNNMGESSAIGQMHGALCVSRGALEKWAEIVTKHTAEVGRIIEREQGERRELQGIAASLQKIWDRQVRFEKLAVGRGRCLAHMDYLRQGFGIVRYLTYTFACLIQCMNCAGFAKFKWVNGYVEVFDKEWEQFGDLELQLAENERDMLLVLSELHPDMEKERTRRRIQSRKAIEGMPTLDERIYDAKLRLEDLTIEGQLIGNARKTTERTKTVEVWEREKGILEGISGTLGKAVSYLVRATGQVNLLTKIGVQAYAQEPKVRGAVEAITSLAAACKDAKGHDAVSGAAENVNRLCALSEEIAKSSTEAVNAHLTLVRGQCSEEGVIGILSAVHDSLAMLGDNVKRYGSIKDDSVGSLQYARDLLGRIAEDIEARKGELKKFESEAIEIAGVIGKEDVEARTAALRAQWEKFELQKHNMRIKEALASCNRQGKEYIKSTEKYDMLEARLVENSFDETKMRSDTAYGVQAEACTRLKGDFADFAAELAKLLSDNQADKKLDEYYVRQYKSMLESSLQSVEFVDVQQSIYRALGNKSKPRTIEELENVHNRLAGLATYRLYYLQGDEYESRDVGRSLQKIWISANLAKERPARREKYSMQKKIIAAIIVNKKETLLREARVGKCEEETYKYLVSRIRNSQFFRKIANLGMLYKTAELAKDEAAGLIVTDSCREVRYNFEERGSSVHVVLDFEGCHPDTKAWKTGHGARTLASDYIIKWTFVALSEVRLIDTFGRFLHVPADIAVSVTGVDMMESGPELEELAQNVTIYLQDVKQGVQKISAQAAFSAGEYEVVERSNSVRRRALSMSSCDLMSVSTAYIDELLGNLGSVPGRSTDLSNRGRVAALVGDASGSASQRTSWLEDGPDAAVTAQSMGCGSGDKASQHEGDASVLGLQR